MITQIWLFLQGGDISRQWSTVSILSSKLVLGLQLAMFPLNATNARKLERTSQEPMTTKRCSFPTDCRMTKSWNMFNVGSSPSLVDKERWRCAGLPQTWSCHAWAPKDLRHVREFAALIKGVRPHAAWPRTWKVGFNTSHSHTRVSLLRIQLWPWLAMAISYNWLFLWDYTFYFYEYVISTGKGPALYGSK